jgi:signal transduction histidine kinase
VNPTVADTILQDRGAAYVIADQDLRVVGAGGAVDIFGGDPRVILGQSLLDLVPELIGCEEVLGDILSGDVPRFQLDWVNRETNVGEMIYLTMVMLPYRDTAGEIVGIIHAMVDDTAMGVVNQQLAQGRNELCLLQSQLTRQNVELAAANAELRRLAEIKSQFVSVAAHELRVPLTSIAGYLEMLLGSEFGPLTAEQRRPLGLVSESAHRLQSLSDELLDMTRIEAERVELILQPVDLPALVETMVAEFRPQLDARDQQLVLRISPALPLALCDEVRTGQIIGNLLSNASKYTPQGGVVTVSLALAEEEGFLELAVADNGVGVLPDDQAELFTPFFRAKSATVTGSKGVGLGLYIARSLVEQHGGRIWFESELDTGSTFHVTLPIAGEPAAASI